MKMQLEDGFLAYDDMGEGIPVLLIHGYPLSKRIWKPQVEALSKVARMITLDLRGHGESYAFKGPYTVDMLAEDCNRLLDELKIATPVIVGGLSMGGYITLAFYRQFSDRVKGLLLISTKAGADSTEGKANRDASIKNVHENGVASIAQGMLPKMVSPLTASSNAPLMGSIRDIMLETSVYGVVGALQAMRDRPDSTALLKQIKCPALILHGNDDQLIPITEAKTMNQLIPNSELVIIPEAGHMLNLEQPGKFNDAVQNFILSAG